MKTLIEVRFEDTNEVRELPAVSAKPDSYFAIAAIFGHDMKVPQDVPGYEMELGGYGWVARKLNTEPLTRTEYDRRFAATQDTTEGFTDAQLDAINNAVFAEVEGLDLLALDTADEVQNTMDRVLNNAN